MSAQLGVHQLLQVYLITYSRANLEIYPTRENFASKIVNAFNLYGVSKVVQWVCSQESHRDGGTLSCIKLEKRNVGSKFASI